LSLVCECLRGLLPAMESVVGRSCDRDLRDRGELAMHPRATLQSRTAIDAASAKRGEGMDWPKVT
jgi:hypothetical protein